MSTVPVVMYKYLIKTLNFACVCFKVLLCQPYFPILIVNLSILNHFNLKIKILVNFELIKIFLILNCFT